MTKALSIFLLSLLSLHSFAIEIATQNNSDHNMEDFFKKTIPVYKEQYHKIRKFIQIPQELKKLSLIVQEETPDRSDITDQKQKLIFRRRWAQRHKGNDFAVYSELTRVLLRETKADPKNWITLALPDYVAKEIYGRDPWWFPKKYPSYNDDAWTSADFLTYLVKKKSPEALKQVLQACYKGQYKDELIKKYFGEELDTLWKDFQFINDPFREDLDFEIIMNIDRAPSFKKEAQVIKKQATKIFQEIEKKLWIEGYKPLKRVNFFLARNMGAPGFSDSPRSVVIDADFFRRNPKDYNLVVHELTHCVQNYPKYVVWVTEGIADLMSYKLGYRKDVGNPRLGGSYKHGYSRAASFLLWMEQKLDKNIVIKLHKLLRDGKYSDQYFIDNFSKDIDTLWAEYQVELKNGLKLSK